jgi:thiamine kinase-like enzyme
MLFLTALLSGLLILLQRQTEYSSSILHRHPTLHHSTRDDIPHVDDDDDNDAGFEPSAMTTSSLITTTTSTTTNDIIQRKSEREVVIELVSTWRRQPNQTLCSIDSDSLSMEPLHEKGFCNALYQVSSIGVAKVFSPLAQARMKQSGFPPGEIDAILAQQKLGPKILSASFNGILMEYLPFQALTEDVIHTGRDDSINQSKIQNIARVLAQTHSAIDFASNIASSSSSLRSLPSNTQRRLTSERGEGGCYPNMLWQTIDVMISIIPREDETRSYLDEQVALHKQSLRRLNLPTVLGHGDFKPANVMIVGDGSAQVLDLECAGRHYRAYDLAKFFRTPLDQETTNKDANQHLFLTSYLQYVTPSSATWTSKQLEYLVEHLLLESNLLLPMTWLEALVFFSISSHMDPENRDQWQRLAQQRRKEYEQSMKRFPRNVHAYAAASTTADAMFPLGPS